MDGEHKTIQPLESFVTLYSVLSSTSISDKDKKKNGKVLHNFYEYFAMRHNVIYERARFNR